MTIVRIALSSALLSALLAVGCANGEPSQDDGTAEAWAAVEAGDCTPDCSGRACGLDPICGVSCGTCSSGESCSDEVGQCEPACVPDCSGRTCGVDPICGVSCGECGSGESCSDAGVCQMDPTEPGEPNPRHCPGGKGKSKRHRGGHRHH